MPRLFVEARSIPLLLREPVEFIVEIGLDILAPLGKGRQGERLWVEARVKIVSEGAGGGPCSLQR